MEHGTEVEVIDGIYGFVYCSTDGLGIGVGSTIMTFQMHKTLRFWVDCSYEDRKYDNANYSKTELIAEILRE